MHPKAQEVKKDATFTDTVLLIITNIVGSVV
jgi:hypothetical protein